jgi:hypothetical protein
MGIRAQTIYSGGKLRTITVASGYYQKYSYLNEYMFNRLRKCKWMVAGQSVSDWVQKSFAKSFPSGIPEGYVHLSGDGKACTDYFDSDFMDSVIDVLVDAVPFPGMSKEKMKADLKAFTTSAEFSETLRQISGQLMASDLSFPVLCMISFTAHLEGRGLIDVWMEEKNDGKFKKMILDYDECGVNGDDITSIEPLYRNDDSDGCRAVVHSGFAWQQAFKTVGGVPEPSKSPLSKRFFTINSEMWYWDGDWKEVGTILPALLVNVSANAHSHPDEKFFRITYSPAFNKSLLPLLSFLTLPYVPRVYGGSGIYSPVSLPHWLVYRMVSYATFSRPCSWVEENKELGIQIGEHQSIRTDGKRVTGYISLQDKDKLAQQRFGNKAVYWSKTQTKKRLPSEVRMYVEHLDATNHHSIKRREYNLAVQHYNLQVKGLKYVKNFTLYPEDEVSFVPADLGFSTIRPKGIHKGTSLREDIESHWAKYEQRLENQLEQTHNKTHFLLEKLRSRYVFEHK